MMTVSFGLVCGLAFTNFTKLEAVFYHRKLFSGLTLLPFLDRTVGELRQQHRRIDKSQ